MAWLIHRAGDPTPVDSNDISLRSALDTASEIAIRSARISPGEPVTVRVYLPKSEDAPAATITATIKRSEAQDTYPDVYLTTQTRK